MIQVNIRRLTHYLDRYSCALFSGAVGFLSGHFQLKNVYPTATRLGVYALKDIAVAISWLDMPTAHAQNSNNLVSGQMSLAPETVNSACLLFEYLYNIGDFLMRHVK